MPSYMMLGWRILRMGSFNTALKEILEQGVKSVKGAGEAVAKSWTAETKPALAGEVNIETSLLKGNKSISEAGESMWTQDAWTKVDNIVKKKNVEFKESFANDFDSSMEYLKTLNLGDDVVKKFNPNMPQWEAS